MHSHEARKYENEGGDEIEGEGNSKIEIGGMDKIEIGDMEQDADMRKSMKTE